MRHAFQPGQSGNPGGSYKSRPYTDAVAHVSTMTVRELNGRAIHPNRWKGLVKFQFQPGQSGNPRGALTHGMSGTREYRVWLSMKNRCYNSLSTSWKYYGGR